MKTRVPPWVLLAALSLSACAAPGTRSGSTAYRCEHGIAFSVRFADDSARIEGTQGQELLFRDAGGQGPAQAVYSNARMRAEFGLGAGGREARVRYPLLPLVARCVPE